MFLFIKQELNWTFCWRCKRHLCVYSPLAIVAHNISPVPALNCELLNGPGPHRGGVLSVGYCSGTPILNVFTGKWKQGLKLASKAAENSPDICGVTWDQSNCGSVRWCPRNRVVFFTISLTAGPETSPKTKRCSFSSLGQFTSDFISTTELFAVRLWGERGDYLALDASCKALCSSF